MNDTLDFGKMPCTICKDCARRHGGLLMPRCRPLKGSWCSLSQHEATVYWFTSFRWDMKRVPTWDRLAKFRRIVRFTEKAK